MRWVRPLPSSVQFHMPHHTPVTSLSLSFTTSTPSSQEVEGGRARWCQCLDATRMSYLFSMDVLHPSRAAGDLAVAHRRRRFPPGFSRLTSRPGTEPLSRI